ncbi:hypothetical protein [Cupriavidus pinatubonensis]|uniref:hypothetical protein n=1 Tax=Cupriavidus pinatubonensis TaxID=248026 RepID=UPI001CC50C21|nr:hypothetical protein [Cupriavidus pinatubonensis]
MVVHESFTGVFEGCKVGRHGVEVIVSPVEVGEQRLTLEWEPASYAILVEETNKEGQKVPAKARGH